MQAQIRMGTRVDPHGVRLRQSARQMLRVRLLASLGLVSPIAAAPITAPTVVPLTPASTRIDLTVYAMGLFPLPAHFVRFSGTLAVISGPPLRCSVAIRIEAASLEMEDAQRAQTAIGPHLLDAAHFPDLIYQGSCTNGQATGELTLHGVTRPLTLTATRTGDQVSASGTLRRQEYGITGLPGLIGRSIGIRFTVRLPPGLAARINP